MKCAFLTLLHIRLGKLSMFLSQSEWSQLYKVGSVSTFSPSLPCAFLQQMMKMATGSSCCSDPEKPQEPHLTHCGNTASQLLKTLFFFAICSHFLSTSTSYMSHGLLQSSQNQFLHFQLCRYKKRIYFILLERLSSIHPAKEMLVIIQFWKSNWADS